MDFPVLRGVSYVLVHAPDMLVHMGTTQAVEREANPDSDYLKELSRHLRSYSECKAYPPNQAYIGNITPDELAKIPRPWHENPLVGANRLGGWGEIMPEDQFYALMKAVDSFDLVVLEEGFTAHVAGEIRDDSIWVEDDRERLGTGASASQIEELVGKGKALGLYVGEKLAGCVKAAHESDETLAAHVMAENLAAKASGTFAMRHLAARNGIDSADIEYVIECSEEACGDMNQRGGGNFAKAIGETSGCINASGCDVRGFCAAPAHALVIAAGLVQSGIFKNVAVVGGGSTAKLGMNGRDHVRKDLPVLEDVLAGFAILVSANDGVSPAVRTDAVGRHKIGSGSSPEAVMTAIVVDPVQRIGLSLREVDKYSPEMQNPEITELAGAGDVPTANLKMIAALAVKRGEIARGDLGGFVKKHGMPGFAPTQGHVPSGVPSLGYLCDEILAGRIRRAQIIGKGSLFLGRMTNLFDGISFIIESNPGKGEREDEGEAVAMAARVSEAQLRKIVADALRKVAQTLVQPRGGRHE